MAATLNLRWMICKQCFVMYIISVNSAENAETDILMCNSQYYCGAPNNWVATILNPS